MKSNLIQIKQRLVSCDLVSPSSKFVGQLINSPELIKHAKALHQNKTRPRGGFGPAARDDDELRARNLLVKSRRLGGR